MKLAIGDIVRDHRDMALGSVVGVADHADGKIVAFCVSGDSVRVSGPEGLDVVARHTRPLTGMRRLTARIAFVIALLASFISGIDAWALSADWRFVLVAAVGGYSTVAFAYHWGNRLIGPRRFRV